MTQGCQLTHIIILSRLQVPILPHRIETRTCGGGHCSVPYDEGLRISRMKPFQQSAKRRFLLGGSGVGGSALGIKASDVTHAERMLIMTFAMSAHHLLWAARLHTSIKVDNIVITNHFPAPRPVPAVDVAGMEVASLGRGAAMYYNQGYGSHRLSSESSSQAKHHGQPGCHTDSATHYSSGGRSGPSPDC